MTVLRMDWVSAKPFAGLGASAREALASIAVPKRFARDAWLLRGGTQAEWVHFIERGLVREFYISAEGEEHTRVFLAEGDVSGSLLDLLSGAPSVTWIQALEEVSTIAWRYAEFDVLTRTHPELLALARAQAEALAVRKTQREFEMLALSAPERLARWRADCMHLDSRVTRKLLASYLGITPVHLSRIS